VAHARADEQKRIADTNRAGKARSKVFVGVEEGRNPPSYEQVAQSLRVGVGTAKTLIHRFRKQYTVILRQEIGRTVSDPADIEQEIHALCDALVAAEGRL
jgi:transposase